jgi:anti-anti-sigma factor
LGCALVGSGMVGEVTVGQEVTVARLRGDLDLVNVDLLRNLLEGVVAGPGDVVVVDLGDVPFIDVLSLSVILGAADDLRETGRRLVVDRASTSVRRLCALLNAEDVLAPPVTLSPRPHLVTTPGGA